jgi:hypothetical protein
MDLFGNIWICLDGFGSIGMGLDGFKRVGNYVEFMVIFNRNVEKIV